MPPETTAPTKLIHLLVTECGFERRRTVSSDHFEVHYLDLTSLKLRVSPDSTPFVVSKRFSGHSHITSADLSDLIDSLKTHVPRDNSTGCVVVLGGTLQAIKSNVRRAMATGKVAVLARNDLQAAVEPPNAEGLKAALCASLVSALGRQSLSPYSSKIPATAGSFFGREQTLRRVFSVPDNFTFFGNRRIGKTSLLQEIKHRLKRGGSPAIADLYGALCSSSEEVLTRILKELDPSGNFERLATVETLEEVFRATVSRLSKQQLVVVIVDELDKILEFDYRDGHKLMELFREVFHKTDNTRFYSAGFRRTRSAMRDVNTPLYGFTSGVPIERLTVHETRDMVEMPLLNLGVDIRATPITEAIFTETAGHPELVQLCCSEVIRQVDERETLPSPTQILTEVFQSGDFREKVFGAFLANTNGYERLASYLLMQDGIHAGGTFDSFAFESSDINACLKRVGKEPTTVDLYTITENLLTCGVIVQQRGGHRYKFAVPQLARYCQNYNLDFMIQKCLDEIGTLRTWSEAIRGESEA